MKSIIHELWGFNIFSVAASPCVANQQAPILHELNELHTLFLKRMKEEDIAVLEKMQDLHSELSAIEAEEGFVRGFLLGAKLVLEIGR